MNRYFENKVVIVTGGASGLGESIAISLSDSGCRVIVIDSNPKSLETFTANNRDIPGFFADVTDEPGLRAVIDQVTEIYGIPSIVINNAGIFIAGEARDMNNRQWRECIEVNLLGMINMISIVYPGMAERGTGQIVNIASLVSLAPLPLIVPYVASKYGIIGLTRSLRIEARSLGVKVNLVCPGRLETAMLENAETVNAERERFIPELPFKPYPLKKAANKILSGIRKDRGMIIFPWYVYCLWYAERFSNRLLFPFYVLALKRFRKIRGQNTILQKAGEKKESIEILN
jgi:NAD(P)-dependent dehydrogenase (short-subunit alcohol dehydrogenase family)